MRCPNCQEFISWKALSHECGWEKPEKRRERKLRGPALRLGADILEEPDDPMSLDEVRETCRALREKLEGKEKA